MICYLLSQTSRSRLLREGHVRYICVLQRLSTEQVSWTVLQSAKGRRKGTQMLTHHKGQFPLNLNSHGSMQRRWYIWPQGSIRTVSFSTKSSVHTEQVSVVSLEFCSISSREQASRFIVELCDDSMHLTVDCSVVASSLHM